MAYNVAHPTMQRRSNDCHAVRRLCLPAGGERGLTELQVVEQGLPHSVASETTAPQHTAGPSGTRRVL